MRDGQRLKSLEAHPHFGGVLKIVRRLQQEGHQTVLAGGCVRDSLLGLTPKDLDLATSAAPEVVESCFERTIAVGKAFGTIVVVLEGQNFEVTTFRTDGPYLNGRHPSKVSFSDIHEDARRRDFTINALFYDPLKAEVLDLVDGQADLEKGLLRTVGEAEQRFAEDRLRMLRAVRFVGQLGFRLEEKTAAAIRHQALALRDVSVERIHNECKRLLESKYLIQGLVALKDSNLTQTFWPEFNSFQPQQLSSFARFLNWENTFAAICWLTKTTDPEPRLRAWKSSRDSLRRIQAQLQALRVFQSKSSRAERARCLGGEVYAELVVLLSGLFPEESVRLWIDEYLAIADADGQLPKPFVTGEDLRQQGVAPGAEMGKYLRESYDAQLEGRVRSRPEALSELSKSIKA